MCGPPPSGPCLVLHSITGRAGLQDVVRCVGLHLLGRVWCHTASQVGQDCRMWSGVCGPPPSGPCMVSHTITGRVGLQNVVRCVGLHLLGHVWCLKASQVGQDCRMWSGVCGAPPSGPCLVSQSITGGTCRIAGRGQGSVGLHLLGRAWCLTVSQVGQDCRMWSGVYWACAIGALVRLRHAQSVERSLTASCSQSKGSCAAAVVSWFLSHAKVSQERNCSDNCTCCLAETEVADQTRCLTLSCSILKPGQPVLAVAL